MSVIPHIVRIENICRTCLSKDPNMKSVFDTDSYYSGETHKLFEILMACTSVQVAPDDGLPAQICLSCINYMARSFTFKKLCEDSDATLRKLLGIASATDDETLIELKSAADVLLPPQRVLEDIDTDALDIEMKFEEGETNIRDPITGTAYSDCERDEIKTMINNDNLEAVTIQSVCNENPNDIQNELVHDNTVFPTNTSVSHNERSNSPMSDERTNVREQPNYPCDECIACFTAEEDLMIHCETQHTAPGHTYKCKECGKVYKTLGKLNNHLKAVHGPKEHACNECDKAFARLSDFAKHAKTHTGERPYACTLCDRRFAQADSYFKHNKRIHKIETNFSCSICGEGFLLASTLRHHQKTHTGMEPHTCQVCGRRCPDKTALAVHLKTHTGEKDQICADCGRGFVTVGQLKNHRRIHTGERPFICNVCDKGFASQSNLKTHRRTHSGSSRERPYVCNFCVKRYTAAAGLARHLRVHTGERPFKCHLCPKTYAHDNNLREHIKSTHIGKRDHVCVHCKQGFYVADKLKVHLRVHTGKRPYTCHTCKLTFTTKGNILRHLQRNCKQKTV